MTNQTNSLNCDTNSLEWQALLPGVERRLIASPTTLDNCETSLLRVAAGADLKSITESADLEIVLLGGQLMISGEPMGAGDYARLPRQAPKTLGTPSGCTLFLKAGEFSGGDEQVILLHPAETPWQAGHGNLRVKGLHEHLGHHSALVRWPAGERFVPHQHFGGEEILVLSGTFEDEHGRYPQGTWMQSPHGSSHHPFVREETLIFVKTGHLPELHN
jgi:hypothetical protein